MNPGAYACGRLLRLKSDPTRFVLSTPFEWSHSNLGAPPPFEISDNFERIPQPPPSHVDE